MTNVEQLIGYLLVWSPTIVSGLVFLYSFNKEPRQFRNAFFFLFFIGFLCIDLALAFAQWWMVAPIFLIIAASPVVTVIFLLVNTWIVTRREGVGLSTLLPLFFAVSIVGWFAIYPVFFALKLPTWITAFASLITMEGLWFFFSFVALLVYSTSYRLLPRKRVYDYIVIHGAGLNGEEPTPLLRGRIDKALKLWRKQGEQGILIPSGGQGSDEVISEAEAMHHYLVAHGVPEESILDEDRSTTTMENLIFTQKLMDVHHRGLPYRCALVTSDYHVFRTATYARQLHLKADGIGSHTRSYYWPTAFIREFIAVTRCHLMPYLIIFLLWLLPFFRVIYDALAHDAGLL